ncbi:MAG: site-2 protease family protein [Ruminococcaceae bacterium]|nr:site-2 protease family protein [Oscillospiraceae bacterium]
MNTIARYLITVPAVLLVIMLHELAHGIVAYKLGDPTAKRMGRLTLNPLKHLDPIGAVCMVLFHFGWAKPVPVDTRYFRNPKRDMALTALAGPLSNILFAFLAVPVYLLVWKGYVSVAVTSGMESFAANFILTVFYFVYYFHAVSLGLSLFNLIPLPPLDGSRILFAFLPPRYYFSIMRYERMISFALMLFLLTGANFGFLNGIASGISGLMESVWMLLPIF